MNVYKQRIQPSFSYPVVFTRDLFATGNSVWIDAVPPRDDGQPNRFMTFLDCGAADAHPGLADRITAYAASFPGRLLPACRPVILPGGEEIKNDYRRTMEIVDLMLEHRMCRQSYVLALGGGALLDAVGFAVSIVHRGLRLIRCPSTVLAQNDAGIGVKNGMNLHGGKNTIGTFHPPFAVLNDFDLLETLTDTDWRGGISEAFKVAMIKDAVFFDWLCEHADQLRNRDARAMEHLVTRCAELHLDHIRDNGDPFELGTARPLDFGHWAAHKLESMSSYRIGHGQAVAMGMALDSAYAVRKKLLTVKDYQRLIQGLASCGLPLWFNELDRRLGDGSLEVLRGIDDFREHLGGRLCITLPDGIGRRRELHEVDCDLLTDCLRELKEYAGVAAVDRTNPTDG